jgi:excisionase family DNA binding protein
MTKELDRLMTIGQLSEMLGVPVDTLYGWRHRGEGPRGYRIGRHVRYHREAVEAWLDTQADRSVRTPDFGGEKLRDYADATSTRYALASA